MDPFNMPSFGGQANDAANLNTAIAQTAPAATQYHGPLVGAGISQYTPPTAAPTGGSNIAKFGSFFTSLGSEVGHLAIPATKWLGTNTANLAEAPFKLAQAGGHTLSDAFSTNSITAQSAQIRGQMDTLNGLYKSGSISTKDYTSQLDQLSQDLGNLTNESKALNTRLQGDSQATQQAGWNTAAAVVTVMSGGANLFGDGVANTARLLTADVGENLTPAAANLGKLAVDSTAFKSLPDAAQFALQHSVADVVANGDENMTSQQIARAAVTNLAFKFPIYYNMLSTTGKQIYTELDNEKYGDAVRTSAFNALLLLSGGPIGHALDLVGKGVGAVMARTFEETPFLDELSGGFKEGDRSLLYNTINKVGSEESTLDTSKLVFFDKTGLPETLSADQIKARLVRNYSALEATNLAATGKNEPVAAAWRVINGMANYEGASMKTFTTEEGIINNNNFAEAQRSVDTIAKTLGIPAATVGRVDARQLSDIATQLMGKGDTEARLAKWEEIKHNNPTFAWANSDTLDKQIKSVIARSGEDDELSKNINNIKASFQLKGFPHAMTQALSKAGYIAIKPIDIEAPFVEGTGKVASSFAENGDLWTKSVTPLPVMGHIGDMLTGMGLSPNASVQRAYQLYNANVAVNLNQLKIGGIDKALEDAGVEAPKLESAGGFSKSQITELKKQGFTDDVIKKMKPSDVGGTEEEAVEAPVSTKESQSQSDFINKVLSDYRRAPTPTGGIATGTIARAVAHMPITDYRQLTPKMIQQAFKDKKIAIDLSDATDIKRAVAQSWLQMPLATRGLGDRLIDANYRLNPLAGRYSRLQGALRFAWNPFFQNLRAIPKTEILASAHGGGYINAVFAGEYSKIAPTRQLLRDNGFLDEKVGKGGIGGDVTAGAEGVEASGDTGRNLGRKLLPQQERSIAGLVVSQANKMGTDVDTYLKEFPEQVRDMVQSIAEYDRNANFLNSPMARTLNIAIFPFRFEVKVGTAMAKALAKTAPLTQVAFIKGTMNAHQWLNSTEGQAWYSHNSEAIGLFAYMTPLSTISEVGDALGLQHNAIGEYGELGGLPFGFIPQILDAEGLTHFNQPGVDAKTGAIIPDYVPITQRGQAETAIQDFIGSLYSYPGATAGLPSKASINRAAAMGITGATKARDLQLVTPTNLSAQQHNYSQTIQKLSGQTPLQTPPPATTLQDAQVPAQPTPAENPPPRKGSSTSTTKKKESEETPQLLPGQSQLGQL